MAQTNRQELTLEDLDNKWGLIPQKYPSEDFPVSKKTKAMPYEAAKDMDGNEYDAVNSTYTFAIEFTNRQRVWRYQTRGDYYLINLKTKQKRQLGAGLPEASLMFTKFSPDGQKVAYVSKNNIYLESCNMNDTKIQKLTTDGNDTIVNGTFDWVYEEEFDCRDGFRWSGDSRNIAYWQSNTSGTGWFEIIDNVDSIYPTVHRFPYPKAGTANSAVHIGVLDVTATGTPTQWLDIPGDLRENYLPRMEFVPETNKLMIQQMNRPQNLNTVWTSIVKNGTATKPVVLCTDSDKAWVETNDHIHWLAGNKYFIFTSERDGWRHLYRVSADGKKWTCITKGNFDVINEIAFDEQHGYIYFSASPDNATELYMFRTKVMGNGYVDNITAMCHQKPAAGQYSYDLSPNYDYAVETYSSANHLPQYCMIKMDKKGKWSQDHQIEDNAKGQKVWESYGFPNIEFVKVKSGNLMLDAWILKPVNFDPTKKYPVIDYVYGEPASATVQNKWDNDLYWHYLANQGYIIVSIDNRGANCPRGREWRKCIYEEIGVAASEDQAQGIMNLCRKYEYMDSTRLGITGWSGGGAQTLNCMFRYPNIFKTGIAIAFVSDQRLYDTIYQERYMNTPQNNPDGYFRGSPINFTEGLKGNLLIIHGTGDDNVHYQNTEMLVNKLISQGKIFYQVSYPMRTHGINEGIGTRSHLRKTLIDFWKKNL